jgi:phage repressor protein C with HTH and peptisase S24 domain
MENMETIKDRLVKYQKSLGIGQGKFEKETGLGNGFISKIKKDISTSSLDKIRIVHPELNIDWLLTGTGNMLKTENGSSEPKPSIQKGRPYFNVDFELGFDMMVNDQTRNPEYLIDYPPYNDKATCYCNVTGNSMSPTIEGGDIIALKEIEDFSILLNDKIYAIVTTNDLRTVKRIEDKGEVIVLKPDNKEYTPQTIPRNKLSKVYQVIGSIKKF